MTPESLFLAFVLAALLLGAASGRVRLDLGAMLMLLALAVPIWPEDGRLVGILEVREAFAGFGSPAVVMIVAMFVLSAAMQRSGAAELLGSSLLRRAGSTELRLVVATLGIVTLFSAVVSDTTSVLVWMPLLMAIARQQGHAPGRLLLPLAFAALLGGQWTLIGTRTNVVVSDFLLQETGSGLSFLALTPIAMCITVVVGAWIVIAGRRLLPRGGGGESLASRYDVVEYLTEVLAQPNAEMVGRTVAELDLRGSEDVQLLGIARGEEVLPPSPWILIRSGDVLIVQGRITQLSRLLEREGVEVREELRLGDRTLRSVDLSMVEAVVTPNSSHLGLRVAETDFHERYGLSVLAVGRGGHALEGAPSAQRLRAGDSLLLVGHEEMIRRLRESVDLILLETRPAPTQARPRAKRVVAIALAMVAAAAFRVVDPALAVVLAATATIVVGALPMRSAYQAVDWRVVLVLGGMLPFGHALEKTGSAEAVAATIVDGMSAFGPFAVFATLCFVVLVLTQVVENTAAAVVLAPVAYRLALATDSEPLPFLVGTALCASAGFASPLAHECTLLVMAPGDYRFRHYALIGIPAALLTFGVTIAVVPLVYPL